MTFTGRLFAFLLVTAYVAGSAAAVTPAVWRHASEADFAPGEFDSAAVTSRGRVRLGRSTDVLLGAEDAPVVVSAVATDGQAVYAGSGVEPVVYVVGNEAPHTLAELPGTMVTTLVHVNGRLLAGTGGDGAGVFEIAPDGSVETIWIGESVKYVWAIAPAGQRDVLYVATGPEATVYRVSGRGAQAQAEAIYRVDEKLAKNVLCLAVDGDVLYAGTDASGLVIRMDPARRTGRVLFDADEAEIAALVPDGAGGLFAATSDAARADAEGGGAQPNGGPSGRAVPAEAPATRPAEDDASDDADGDDDDDVPDPFEPAQDEVDESKTSDAPDVGDVAPEPLGTDAVRPSAPTTRPGAATRPAVATRPATAPPTRVTGPARTRPAPANGGQVPPAVQQAIAARRAAAAAAQQGAGGPGGQGNAVYHIGADGLVRAVIRRPVTVLAMIPWNGRLLLATGNEGRVYSITRDGDEVVQLVDTDAKQVTSLAPAGGDRVVFGTANKGSVVALSGDYADRGAYVSTALDAGQIARWGTLAARAETPGGTSVRVATRSGNVAEPSDATWSEWTDARPLQGEALQVASPAGRFLQYRLTLATPDAATTPQAGDVRIVYQVGNLAPSVQGVVVQPSATDPQKGGPPAAGGAQVYRVLAVQAADPNKDELRYDVDFREVDGRQWVRIAEDIEQPTYAWDTRTVGDGAYELRVTVTDEPSNPPATALSAARISEPVVVDNTAPVVNRLRAEPREGGATISGLAVDAGSRIVSLHYAVDSQEQWVAMLPADGICDSKREAFETQIEDLDPGAHRIAVRVIDLYGNEGYVSISVTAPGR